MFWTFGMDPRKWSISRMCRANLGCLEFLIRKEFVIHRLLNLTLIRSRCLDEDSWWSVYAFKLWYSSAALSSAFRPHLSCSGEAATQQVVLKGSAEQIRKEQMWESWCHPLLSMPCKGKDSGCTPIKAKRYPSWRDEMLEDRWAKLLNICSMSRYDQAERLLQRVLMHSHDLKLAM